MRSQSATASRRAALRLVPASEGQVEQADATPDRAVLPCHHVRERRQQVAQTCRGRAILEPRADVGGPRQGDRPGRAARQLEQSSGERTARTPRERRRGRPARGRRGPRRRRTWPVRWSTPSAIARRAGSCSLRRPWTRRMHDSSLTNADSASAGGSPRSARPRGFARLPPPRPPIDRRAAPSPRRGSRRSTAPLWFAPRQRAAAARRRRPPGRRARRTPGTATAVRRTRRREGRPSARPRRARRRRARRSERLSGPATIHECEVSTDASATGSPTRRAMASARPTIARRSGSGTLENASWARKPSRRALIALSPDGSNASARRRRATISASSSTRSA